jgi:WD40 repeat protein
MSTHVEREGTHEDSAIAPYPGLEPYTEDSSAFFFGRDNDVRIIADNALSYPVSVLYGPSGVGKSSVLRAGVIRHVRAENAHRLEQFGALETVVAYASDWRDDPVRAVARTIDAAFAETPGVGVGTEGSADAQEVLEVCGAQDVDLLLVLDQFEEVFLYHEDVEPLAEWLADLVQPGSRVSLLLSIREDAVARLDELEPALPGIFDNTIRLEHLDEASARLAVTGPLERHNATSAATEAWSIEPALVDELLQQVRTGRVRVDSAGHSPTPGADQDVTLPPGAASGEVRIEAPYLQLVLRRLWDEESARGSRALRVSTLHELGGAERIVRQHLDRVVARFTPAEVDLMLDAFGHLVTPSGSKIAHTARDLAMLTQHEVDGTADVLHRLSRGSNRILREVPGPLGEVDPAPRFEIFHDVLALAVLDWRRRTLAAREAASEQEQLVAERERAVGEAHEARRRLRRTRMVVSGLALLLVGCLALTAAVVWSLQETNEAQEAADQNLTLDEVNRLLETDPSAALVRALRDWEEDGSSDYEDALRRALDTSDTEVRLDHGVPVVATFFVRDDALVSVTQDGRVRLWRSEGSSPYRVVEDPVTDVDVTDAPGVRALDAVLAGDASHVVVTTSGGTAHVVDLEVGAVEDLTGFDGNVYAESGKDGSGDLVLLNDDSLHGELWDVTVPRQRRTPRMPDVLMGGSLDPSGRRLVTVSGDLDVVVHDTSSGQTLASTPVASVGGRGFTWAIADFVDEETVVLALSATYTEMFAWHLREEQPRATGGAARQYFEVTQGTDGTVATAMDKQVHLRAADGTEMYTLEGRDWVTEVAFLPSDPQLFVAGGRDGVLSLYDRSSAKPLWQFRGHRGPLTDVGFSSDGTHLVTASGDGTVRVWRVPDREVAWRQGQGDWVVVSRFTPDGRFLVGTSFFGQVARTDRNGRRTVRPSGSTGSIWSMDPAPDGSAAVLVDSGGFSAPRIVRFDDTPPPDLDPPTGSFVTIARWSPDASVPLVAAGTFDGRLLTWDVDNGDAEVKTTLDGSGSPVTDLELTGDGGTAVASTDDGVVHVVRLDDGATIARWQAGSPDAVDISTDGRFVATASTDDQSVRVWEVAGSKGRLVHTLTQLRSTPGDVTFSPDDESSRVAITGADGTIYVWRRSDGRLLAQLDRHSDAANSVAFDPQDLDHLVSAADDSVLASYRCLPCEWETEDLAEAAERRRMQVIDLTQ